ncbi:glucokinase [Luteibacter aegosomatis]|uniref:glucokinase n=1 Tax=Luteibacter aegosomatis TaxID=2911537 RepID=UPI001FF86398|nr:glucokinase [Luteibacter aegosomatis]UPG87704.1 glucokinase [Luteibacter aegosomatis]
MGKFVNQSVVASSTQAARPILAADVGGTHARIALVANDSDGNVRVLCHHRYVGAEWPSLAAILDHFLAAQSHVAPWGIERCAIAIAGFVLGDNVTNGNLPWRVSLSDIRSVLHTDALDVVNDFEAVAYASQFVDRAEATTILPGAVGDHRAPVVVMGPGTGLGSAVLLPGSPHAQVLSTEAGQIALAPGDELEVEILRILSRTRPYVSCEAILSGPGLLNTYRAVAELKGSEATWTTPGAVSAAGIAGTDPVARIALDVFCAVLGGFAGDLAMLYGARGGLFLAGGILPQMREFILSSRFAERFFNKGVMRPFLEQVPVWLVDHGHLGVVGAATLHARARVGVGP